MRVAAESQTCQCVVRFASKKNREVLCDFYRQKVLKELKFTPVFALGMGTIFYLADVYTSG
jgi:hypothetical protein